MIDVYVYRPGGTLVYHMTTAIELAALIAAFRSMTGWNKIEAHAPGQPPRLFTPD